jgi:F0F1-type ATP synthase membrane subunit b/b'
MVLFALFEGTKVDLIPDGTMFIHIGLILLMIFILNRTFFKPINRVLEAREKSKGGVSEAARILSDVETKEARYNEALRDARTKGYDVIEEVRSDALAKKNDAVGAAKLETESKLVTDAANLEKLTGEARASIASEAEKMAERISSTILRG